MSLHDPVPRSTGADRLARLGRALVGLSGEPAASRREVGALQRENAALRAKLAGVEAPRGAIAAFRAPARGTPRLPLRPARRTVVVADEEATSQ